MEDLATKGSQDRLRLTPMGHQSILGSQNWGNQTPRASGNDATGSTQQDHQESLLVEM